MAEKLYIQSGEYTIFTDPSISLIVTVEGRLAITGELVLSGNPGTNGQIFTSAGVAASPTWEDNTFERLIDAPLFTGNANKFAVVNAAATALSFIDPVLANIDDVVFGSPNILLVDDLLSYNGTSWINIPTSTFALAGDAIPDITDEELGTLEDVFLTGLATNDLLRRNAINQWVNIPDSTYLQNLNLVSIDSLSDVDFGGTPTDGYVLAWSTVNSRFELVEQTSVGSAALDNLSDVIVPITNTGDVLRYSSGAWRAFADSAYTAGSGLQAVSDDLNPILGGNLSVGAFGIVSPAATNIAITPGTTGSIVLDSLNWPQSDGAANNVLQTNGAGQLSWVAQTGGSTALNDLSDVAITANDLGDLLRYNGTNWVDYPDSNFATSAQGALADTALQDITGESIGSLADVAITVSDLGDLLRYNGTNWVDYPDSNFATSAQGALADTALQNIVEDLLPKLGGDLDVNSWNIISAAAVDITLNPGVGGSVVLGQAGSAMLSTGVGEDLILNPGVGGEVIIGQSGAGVIATGAGEDLKITPGTTGNLVLDGLNWPQADGSLGQLLTTDGAGQLSWASTGSGSFSSPSGFIILANGWMIQFGTAAAVGTVGQVTVTFPNTFNTVTLVAYATFDGIGAALDTSAVIGTSIVSTSQLTIYNGDVDDTRNIHWLVIGN